MSITKEQVLSAFDLERAKAGDEFECFYGSTWRSVFWEDDRFYEMGLDDEYSWMIESGDNLRMKYPSKKVKS